jgi:hypothetical protein
LNGGLRISFVAPLEISYASVFYTTGTTWTQAQGVSSNDSTVAFTILGLQNEVAVSVWVVLRDSLGAVVKEFISVTEAPATPPVAPTFELTPLDMGIRIHSIAFTSVVDTVQYSIDDQISWSNIPVGANDQIIMGLQNEQEYEIAVRGFNRGVAGLPATKRQAPAQPPQTPTIAIVPDSTSLSIGYDFSSEQMTPFQVQYSINNSEEWYTVVRGEASAQSVGQFFLSIEPDEMFSIQVRGINRGVVGNHSEPARAWYGALPVIEQITPLDRALTVNASFFFSSEV